MVEAAMESGGLKEEMFEKHLDRNRSGSGCKMCPCESSDTRHVVFIKQFGGKGIMVNDVSDVKSK
jgi:hypothetical protein